MTKKVSKYTGKRQIRLNVIDFIFYYYYRKSQQNQSLAVFQIPYAILGVLTFTFIYIIIGILWITKILFSIHACFFVATIIIIGKILTPFVIERVYLKKQRINLIVSIIKRKPKEFREKMMRNVRRYIIFIYSLFPASIIIGMLCVRLYQIW